jgi:hypothetical protein
MTNEKSPSETPDAPDAPDAPNTPQPADASQAADAPQAAQAPQATDTPQVAEATEATDGINPVQAAINAYLNLFGGVAPGGSAGSKELSDAFMQYAGRNVANAVAFAQKLGQVKDVQDLVKLQTEFIKSQMDAINEQATAIGESAAKASAERLERIIAFAEQVFGTREKARRWLRRPRQTLNGQTALAQLASESGAQVVEDMLRRIQQGMTT